MLDIYSKFNKANQVLKKIQDRRDQLRDEILAEAQIFNAERDYLLPVKSLKVPKKYFDVTGQSMHEFTTLRYPGWNVVSYTQEDDNAIIILKKKEIYGGFSHNGEFKTDVIVSEPTPKIDWDTLELEYPGMIDKIAEPVTTYELSEEKFNRELQENPELTEIMQRHIISKPPIMKVISKMIKNDDA